MGGSSQTGSKDSALTLEHGHTDGSSITPKSKRITAKEFEHETCESERLEFVKALTSQTSDLLAANRCVYLEGFGILFPSKQVASTRTEFNGRVLLRSVTLRGAKFEKCSELVNYQAQRYPQIVDTPELCQLGYVRLPLSMQFKWSEGQARRLFCGLINKVLREVIISGSSKTLGQLGIFYASHNRQGATLADWFAGADIFFESAEPATIKVGACHLTDPLVLRDSLELLEAGFGTPLQKFTLNLRDQLAKLGSSYNLDRDASYQPEVSVAVFAKDLPNNEKRLFYCTEGMRALHADTRAGKPGAEFVAQVSIVPESPSSPGMDSIPLWPLRALTLAWLLMESSKTKTVKVGAGLSLGCRIQEDNSCDQKTILISNFSLCPTTQTCENGSFNYYSICGLCDDEAQVAKTYGADYMMALLKHRKLDQIIRPGRASIVGKRAVPEPTQVN